jgi:hypothetical protein
LKSAVSQDCILLGLGVAWSVEKTRHAADFKSAIRQSATLRYGRRNHRQTRGCSRARPPGRQGHHPDLHSEKLDPEAMQVARKRRTAGTRTGKKLRDLAQRLVSSTDPKEVKRLKAEITRLFYTNG